MVHRWPKCPYCFYVHRSFLRTSLEHWDHFNMDCDKCELTFAVTVYAIPEYRTDKLETNVP